MRKINLNAVEASIVHAVLNMSDPQRGLTMQEVRDAIPLLDMVEANCTQENGQRIFKPVDLVLKESQFEMLKNKFSKSCGWLSVEHGRAVVKLEDKIKDIPFTEEAKEDKK
jgi:hypothetical protein